MNSDNTFVIASEKRWNAELAERLRMITGYEFFSVNCPENLNEEKLEKIKPKYIFFPHWSHRIPASIWGKYETIIFHMTDLPYGRGGSPLQNLIIRGHDSTMLTALRCVEAMDAGPIYLKRPLSLLGTAEEIFVRADKLVENMILEILETRPFPEAQVGEPTIFKRRRPEDGNLVDVKTQADLFNFIRMLDAEGYPSAFLKTEHFSFEFKKATLREGYVEASVIIKKSG